MIRIKSELWLAIIYTVVALITLFWIVGHARADEQKRCVAFAETKETIASMNGKWTELTRDQWEFLRGIYAMHPKTPPGLPYGDRAVMATREGQDDGLIFFLDGDQACTPISAPKELRKLLDDVVTGSIWHDGDKL